MAAGGGNQVVVAGSALAAAESRQGRSQQFLHYVRQNLHQPGAPAARVALRDSQLRPHLVFVEVRQAGLWSR